MGRTSGETYNVVITFMNNTLELNLTLGHQITPDYLPSMESEEILPASEKEPYTIRKTKTTRKPLSPPNLFKHIVGHIQNGGLFDNTKKMLKN